MAVTIKADFRPLTRLLVGVQRNQIPFASANALTDCAKVSATAVRRQLPTIFDRPTPYTLNSIGIQAARKNRLQARIFVKDRQAEYLAIQETGGTTDKPGKGGVIAKTLPLNEFGNVPRGAVRREKRKPDVFVGTVKGHAGLFWRLGGKVLVTLANIVKRATYKPRFGFRRRVEKTVRQVMTPAFQAAMAKALATAKVRL